VIVGEKLSTRKNSFPEMRRRSPGIAGSPRSPSFPYMERGELDGRGGGTPTSGRLERRLGKRFFTLLGILQKRKDSERKKGLFEELYDDEGRFQSRYSLQTGRTLFHSEKSQGGKPWSKNPVEKKNFYLEAGKGIIPKRGTTMGKKRVRENGIRTGIRHRVNIEKLLLKPPKGRLGRKGIRKLLYNLVKSRKGKNWGGSL